MTKQIPLWPEGCGLVAVVDAEDYDRLGQQRWERQLAGRRNDRWVAVARMKVDGKVITVSMHRFLLGVEGRRRHVSHLDGNLLNNQRDNVSVCSKAQIETKKGLTKSNTSGFKGVYWVVKRRYYCAQIKSRGKLRRLGSFSSAIQAARAYDKAAVKRFGEFAMTNAMMGLYEL